VLRGKNTYQGRGNVFLEMSVLLDIIADQGHIGKGPVPSARKRPAFTHRHRNHALGRKQK
jgi:hypothetical protein